jgi:hypothetical protein
MELEPMGDEPGKPLRHEMMTDKRLAQATVALLRDRNVDQFIAAFRSMEIEHENLLWDLAVSASILRHDRRLNLAAALHICSDHILSVSFYNEAYALFLLVVDHDAGIAQSHSLQLGDAVPERNIIHDIYLPIVKAVDRRERPGVWRLADAIEQRLGYVTHSDLLKLMIRLPQDYQPYGRSERTGFNDCSGGCRFFLKLMPPFDKDWGTCANSKSHRCGLLTFEHAGCPKFESNPNEDP